MKKKYTNGECDFFQDCINGEDIGGEGTCVGCVHNFEEDANGGKDEEK